MVKRGAGAVANAFKFGFGAFSGMFAAKAIFLLVGLVLFVPGLYLLSKERKKEKSQQNLIPAYVLMGLGMVLGLGMGSGVFFENLMANFSE
jgi:uncharacterized membrane protein